MNELIEKAKKHEVEHDFSGKIHGFKVYSKSGNIYEVTVKVSCTCRYQSVQGTPNGKICSHCLAVLNKISKEGGIFEAEDKHDNTS